MSRCLTFLKSFGKAWLNFKGLIYLVALVIAHFIVVSLQQVSIPILDNSIKPLLWFSASLVPAFVLFFLMRDGWAKPENRLPGGIDHILHQQLLSARDWETFVDVLLQFPKSLLPLSGSSLTIWDPIKGTCDFVKEWSPSEATRPRFINLSEICSFNFIVQPQPLGFFIPQEILENGEGEAKCTCFCLPFPFASRHIGFLLLYLPKDTSLTREQINHLNSLIPEIGFLLEFAHLRHSLRTHSDILEHEQRRIARFLHDTVAQNLAVLHNRLDRLLSSDGPQDLTALRVQLEQIRHVAMQADAQLRESIADLRQEPTVELETALVDFAQETSSSAGFTLEISSEGESQNLPAHLQRQIFSILREAIRNIEKHAGASRVTIHSIWRKHSLTLVLEDDGCGFDFEAALNMKGHYGLKLMQEGAREINGKLAFNSSPGSGTCISLTIPIGEPQREFENIHLYFNSSVLNHS